MAHWVGSLVPSLANNGAGLVVALTSNNVYDWDEIPGTTVRVLIFANTTQISDQTPTLKVQVLDPVTEVEESATSFVLANVLGGFAMEGASFAKPSGLKRMRTLLTLSGAGIEYILSSLYVVFEVT